MKILAIILSFLASLFFGFTLGMIVRKPSKDVSYIAQDILYKGKVCLKTSNVTAIWKKGDTVWAKVSSKEIVNESLGRNASLRYRQYIIVDTVKSIQ